MLKAILFDFDGVIADTELIHFRGFKNILLNEGITLTKQDYYSRYLGFDDWACFKQVYKDRKHNLPQLLLDRLVRRKSRFVKSLLHSRNVLLPGVKRPIQMLSRRYSLAVVSGALRHEVLLVLRKSNLHAYFSVVLGAEDVGRGKPHPDGYLKALKLLNSRNVVSSPIKDHECLVIEDSHWGVEAAHRAKMTCLAVTSSYSKKELRSADIILSGLKEINVKMLPRLERLMH